MLEDYSLDTENFREIMEEAKKMVIKLCPLWTDFNYHDPGITILELFSWLKEGQQYFMNCIGDEHRQKYLEFLGIFREGKKPAVTFVDIDTERNFIMPEGTKLFAKDVCFETLRSQGIFRICISECFQGKRELKSCCKKEQLSGKENIMMPVFGENPGVGERFYIGLDCPVPAGVGISFYFNFAKDLKVRRSPISEPMYYPMMKIKYEYFSGGMWREIEEISDDTYGMLQDGIIYFRIKEEMEKSSVYGREAYYFRMELIECEVDVPPIISGIKLNVFQVIQKDTCIKCEEVKLKKEGDLKCRAVSGSFLGTEGENRLYIKRGELYYPVLYHEKYILRDRGESEFVFKTAKNEGDAVLIVSYSKDSKVKKCIGIGNGFPNQEYELWTDDIAAEDIQILVHEIGGAGALRRWERVIDFGASLPQDYHYVVDSEKGKIIFGDCEQGMAPEGEIILISASETLGDRGNVKAGKINHSVLSLRKGNIKINHPKDAVGGRNEESLDSAFIRAKALLKHPDTAVTYEDYENYVKSTPGLMIESCKAVPAGRLKPVGVGKNRMTIIVKPAYKQYHNAISRNYRKNILAHLDKYRMVGTCVEIIPPKYVPMELCLDLSIKRHYVNAEALVKETVREYLKKLSEKYGAYIIYSELYGILDMQKCVKSVNGISIDIREPKALRTKDGNILLPPDAVIDICPENVKYLISMSEE